MRRTALLLTLTLTLALAPPAAAQEPPRVPTRDFAATYAMTGFGPEAPKSMQKSFHAASQRQRIDLGEAGRNITMIMEPGGARLWMIDHASRTAMELRPGAGPDADVPIRPIDPRARLTPTGTDRVAGLACTVYAVSRSGRPEGTACITEHGIMLRGEFQQDDQRGRMEVTRISLDPQPAERFEVPQGYRTVPMPGMREGKTPR